MDEFALHTILAVLGGLSVGSFLNVVIYRLPKIMQQNWATEHAAYIAEQNGQEFEPDTTTRFNLLTPASACPQCGHRIRWYENIPVISYVALLGKCRSCKAPISFRYPLVELVTAGLAWECTTRYGFTWVALAWFFFAACLLCLALIDWDTTYLPDSLTLPLLWAGLLATSQGWTEISLLSSVWGAAIGYTSLWTIYWGFKLTTGKEGMGFGDFKLFAALGAWFGIQALVPIILMASISGSIVGIVLKLTQGLREGRYVPFGPFLAMGAAVVWYVGATRLLQILVL